MSVQDLFLLIYQRIHQFDEAYPFEPSLMRSVINASLNAVRGTRKLTSLDRETKDMEALLDRAASVDRRSSLRNCNMKFWMSFPSFLRDNGPRSSNDIISRS